VTTLRQVTESERRARLGIRHHLAPSAHATDPVAVAEGVVALHATDPASVYLSALARMPTMPQQDMTAALYDDRTLVRMLGMRRTMFVVPTTFVPVVQHSSSDAVAARLRTRLVKELAAAVDGDVSRWLADVEDAVVEVLRTGGPALAAELSKSEPRLRTQLRFGPADKAYGGPQAITSRVLNLLSAQSRIVRGRPTNGWAGSRYRWEVVESWLPNGLPRMAGPAARAELVRCWLSRFGPGTLADMTWWTGWNQRDTKAALASLDLVEVELNGAIGFLLADDADPVGDTEPWIAFLPALDPTPMGWQGRDWYLPESHRRELFDSNGNIGPSIWADGRIVGGWAQGPAGDVRWQLLEDLGAERADQVGMRAAELTDWHAGVSVIPKFRTPLQHALRGA
jgi:hypothetical protein